ncbi:MAG TPA: DUF6464 family protein [Xenococcaceae cyanobacterium]
MELKSQPTEIILSKSGESLGKVDLDEVIPGSVVSQQSTDDWIPQPGSYVELAAKTYVVLERHHHYQYQIGGYCLQKIALHVQEVTKPQETTLIDGRWVIGNASCKYNARSEVIRCAVNPQGLCQDCKYYEASS